MSRYIWSGFVPLLLVTSCNVFDENLIPEPVVDVAERLPVADKLDCAVPSDESLNAYRKLDMSKFKDDLPSLPNCLGGVSAPGNDAFFAIEMRRDEKWHFHVKVAGPDIDPAVYVLDSCSDSRSCRDTYSGINACSSGQNEHFSFIAPSTGQYFVGLAGLKAGGEPVEVIAVNAQCGNDEKEHSEFCDDGNDDPFDGCHECLPVLSADGPELEPNDGPLDPNLIVLPDLISELGITGSLGSDCDFDFFRIALPENTRLSVALSGNETACKVADLQLREPSTPNPFLIEPTADDPTGACASLDRDDLEAGTYLIRVAPQREAGVDATAVDYTLNVEMTPL